MKPFFWVGIAGLLLLAGCDDQRSYNGPPPGARRAASQPAPTVSAAPDPPASGRDGLDDPLLGGSNTGLTAPPDPLLPRDPLQGRAMPTAHSHWLRGRLRDARVVVLLNGVRHGSFSGVIDQDITMKLRRGVNTAAFVYQPNTAASAADLEIVEGEHDPPISPLVTFRTFPSVAPPGTAASLPPTTQTFTFVAK